MLWAAAGAGGSHLYGQEDASSLPWAARREGTSVMEGESERNLQVGGWVGPGRGQGGVGTGRRGRKILFKVDMVFKSASPRGWERASMQG